MLWLPHWARRMMAVSRSDSAAFAEALRKACPGVGSNALGQYVRHNGGPALEKMRSAIQGHQQGRGTSLRRPETAASKGPPERLVPNASQTRERALTSLDTPRGKRQRDVSTELVPRPRVPQAPNRRRLLLAFGAFAWLGAVLLLWWLWARPTPEEGPALHLPATGVHP